MEKEISLDHQDSVCWSVILPSFLTHTSSPTQTLPAEKRLYSGNVTESLKIVTLM